MKQATLILIIMLILFSISGCKSIFHVELEDHINPNDNEVTNNGLNIENVPTEQFPIELDLVSGEYRAIWKEGYKYDTPILLNNLNDLEEFLSNHPAQSADQDILQQNYDDDFFKESVVYGYVKSEGSGSVKLIVNRAELKEDILKLFMERTVPEEGTDDMATRICLFGINRGDIKNVNAVEGIILDVSSK
ncbi:hypothetical protein [Tissierella pigra]|uniref:Uncharacterized protein n=2 Tax=Tissierella pigra TaxID=2607614 RepID=A0A6N7XXJ0_9FIRM|nr:hypothetical protein [Tissierella pigra]MSU02163.1 hypothetical protein [Tissierella pigra]